MVFGFSPYQHPRLLQVMPVGDEPLEQFFSDERTHAIIDKPSRRDYLWLVAQALGFIHQVIRVDPDAMPAYEPRLELQEIPLGTCCFKYIVGIDIHPVEYQRQLIDKGDIDIPLGIFDGFGRLGYFNGWGRVGTRRNDRSV